VEADRALKGSITVHLGTRAAQNVLSGMAVTLVLAVGCSGEPTPVAPTPLSGTVSPRPSTLAGPADVLVTQRVEVPFRPLQIVRAGSRLWILGDGIRADRGDAIRVLRLGPSGRPHRVNGVFVAGMASAASQVWLALGNGIGVAYGIHETGPGFPQEHALVRIAGGPPARVRVRNPTDLVGWQRQLWALSARRHTFLVRVDPASGSRQASFRVPAETERIITTDQTLWLIGSWSNGGTRLWPVSVRREKVGRPISIRLPFGGLLTGSAAESIVAMNTGPNPQLRVVESRTRRITQLRFDGAFPQGLVLRRGQLWVGSEPRRIDVIRVKTGQLIATGRIDAFSPDLFDAGNYVGVTTRSKLLRLSIAR